MPSDRRHTRMPAVAMSVIALGLAACERTETGEEVIDWFVVFGVLVLIIAALVLLWEAGILAAILAALLVVVRALWRWIVRFFTELLPYLWAQFLRLVSWLVEKLLAYVLRPLWELFKRFCSWLWSKIESTWLGRFLTWLKELGVYGNAVWDLIKAILAAILAGLGGLFGLFGTRKRIRPCPSTTTLGPERAAATESVWDFHTFGWGREKDEKSREAREKAEAAAKKEVEAALARQADLIACEGVCQPVVSLPTISIVPPTKVDVSEGWFVDTHTATATAEGTQKVACQ